VSRQVVNRSGTAIVRIRRSGVTPVEGCLLALPVAAIGYLRWVVCRRYEWLVEELVIGQGGFTARRGRSAVFPTRAEAETQFDLWLDQ
jgi:hypothetical protein